MEEQKSTILITPPKLFYSFMIIRPKHYVLLFLGIVLSSFIFYVNYSWNNPIGNCIYLSVFTFLFWYLCWAVYFEIRDFWQFRWYGKHVDTSHINITPLSIPLVWPDSEKYPKISSPVQIMKNQRHLYGELLRPIGRAPKEPVVIFTHGFSDDSEYVRHWVVPIVLAGYETVVYDCRGTKGSYKAGGKHQFAEISRDLGDVIAFVNAHETLHGRPIYLVGISLGAVASIRQGLEHLENPVGRIIAVAAMGNYYDVLPSSPIAFKKNWWLWLRYRFFGVPINPPEWIAAEISPYMKLSEKSQAFATPEEWKAYINKYLFLIHARDDIVILLSHFYNNQRISQLKTTNWLLSKMGGHNFLKHEMALVASIIAFLNRA